MLKVENVKKAFGDVTVLDGVNLTVSPGEVVSILGSSGSGKSTLIRCINGLEKLNAGRITVDDFDVSKPRDLSEARKRSGTVFQLFNLYPHMTALENITLAPVEVLKRPKAEAVADGRALLASVGLGDRADAYPAQLSGGQRQRVGICRALAMQPRYLLLDEVTSALDPALVGEVLDLLTDVRGTGVTMLVATHELGFARRVADRVAFLHGGRVWESGPPSILDAPATPELAAYLGTP